MCISWLSWAVQVLRTWTTAMLSQWQHTCWPLLHIGPHITATAIIGISSFIAMIKSADVVDQHIWNHRFLNHALHPHALETSNANSKAASGGGKYDMAFQELTNVLHHNSSIDSSDCTIASLGRPLWRSSIRWRKERPGWTTLLVWWSNPTRDSSWCHEQYRCRLSHSSPEGWVWPLLMTAHSKSYWC